MMTKHDTSNSSTTTPLSKLHNQPEHELLPQHETNYNNNATIARIQQMIHSPTIIPLIAGGMGGIVSTTILLPLDIVKLRLQVTESNPARTYRTNIRAIRILGGIIKYEGILGLYQGWTPAVLGASISWGGYFFFYEGFKQQLIQYYSSSQSYNYRSNHHEQIDKPNENDSINTETTMNQHITLSSMDNFMLACLSGAIMVAITNPIWLVKTRMQLQMRRAQQQQQSASSTANSAHNKLVIRPYNTMFDAFRTIVREEGGYRALYKGSGPALLLTSHGGVQFVVYEYLRKYHQQYFLSQTTTPTTTSRQSNSSIHSKNSNVWVRLQQSAGYLTMGAIAKIAATTATYPLQLIKARMQQRMDTIELFDDHSVRLVQRGDSYQTMKSTIQHIYTQEGISGFFKGCITNAVRVAPGAAITFVVYEEVSDFLK